MSKGLRSCVRANLVDFANPKKVGGLELTEDQNKDIRYLKGKIISAGPMADMLKKDDIVRYDKHAGHGIEWKDNLYYVLKLGDIVLVE